LGLQGVNKEEDIIDDDDIREVIETAGGSY